MMYTEKKFNDVSFYVLNDGRAVVHHLDFISDNDRANYSYEKFANAIMARYDVAVERARKFGGKKYRAKWFGGGIVFRVRPEGLKYLASAIVASRG